MNVEVKADNSPVTAADLAAHAILDPVLSAAGFPVLSEEGRSIPYSERSAWDTFWVVDPLDGTKEFIKRNDEFAVNMALIDNKQAIFGLIASPVQEEILLGGKDIGVFVLHFKDFDQIENWKQLGTPNKINQPLVMACSRSHHSGPVLQIINTLKAEGHELAYIKKGSALKFFDLASGRADIYPRFAPTMEWDIAAGQAILEALGGEVVHAETGEPLTYNKANLVNPYFVARTKAMSNKLSLSDSENQ
jgi:3'(2'), 5'-bisphosphate nucleotidase